MVHYSGHALDDNSMHLEGVRFELPILRREWVFFYPFSSVFFEQNEQNYANLVYC